MKKMTLILRLKLCYSTSSHHLTLPKYLLALKPYSTWNSDVSRINTTISKDINYPQAFTYIQHSKKSSQIEPLLYILICNRWVHSSVQIDQAIRLIDNVLDKFGSFSVKFYNSVLPKIIKEFLIQSDTNKFALESLIELILSKLDKEFGSLQVVLALPIIAYYRFKKDPDSILRIVKKCNNPTTLFQERAMIALRELDAYSHCKAFWTEIEKSKVRPIAPFLYKNILFGLVSINDEKSIDHLFTHFQSNKQLILDHSVKSKYPDFWTLQIASLYKTSLNYYAQINDIKKIESILKETQALRMDSVSIYHIVMKRFFASKDYVKVIQVWEYLLERGICPDGEIVKIHMMSLMKLGKSGDIPLLYKNHALDENTFLGMIKEKVVSIDHVNDVFEMLEKAKILKSPKIFNAIIAQLGTLESIDYVDLFVNRLNNGHYGNYKPEISTFNILLKVYCAFESQTVFSIYEKLVESQLQWDKETFIWVSRMRFISNDAASCGKLWNKLCELDCVAINVNKIKRSS